MLAPAADPDGRGWTLHDGDDGGRGGRGASKGTDKDEGGEIKRVENFFSFPSPHPATPGIMCPHSSEYNEIEWGMGGGDLEKKKAGRLRCPLSSHFHHA